MGSLEHNIKEAFETQDAKSSFEGKEAMWNRLDDAMHSRKGVAAFWRVAAVFLGLLLTAGVFAGINYRAQQQAEIQQMQQSNRALAEEMDVWENRALVEAEPIIQIVDKEKIVYRTKIVYKESYDENTDLEQKYSALLDSMGQKQTEEQIYRDKIQKLQVELNNAQLELLALQNQSNVESNEVNQAPFELKSERIELDVSKKPAAKKPEMEVKVFQRNFIENRNNLNKNILRK